MNPLAVITIIRAKYQYVNFVKDELSKLVVPSKSEPGCMRYGVYQDATNDTVFFTYEIWESEIGLSHHLSSEHIKNFVRNTMDKTELFSVNRLNRIA